MPKIEAQHRGQKSNNNMFACNRQPHRPIILSNVLHAVMYMSMSQPS